jgi:hypothetical protein
LDSKPFFSLLNHFNFIWKHLHEFLGQNDRQNNLRLVSSISETLSNMLVDSDIGVTLITKPSFETLPALFIIHLYEEGSLIVVMTRTRVGVV